MADVTKKMGFELRLCAFCGNQHYVFTRKSLSFGDYIKAGLISLAISTVVWQTIEPRAFAVFAIVLGVFEVALIVKRVISLPCNQCGFDPVLYLRSRHRAVEKVKAKIAKRKDDPAVWMGFKKPLRLPVIKKFKLSNGKIVQKVIPADKL